MLCNDLHALRAEAHDILVAADRPLTSETIARRLFGPGHHEDPVARVVLRHLLQDDRRFVRTHAGRWSASAAPHLDLRLAGASFAVVDLETTGSVLGVDAVIEIGVIVLRGGRIVGRFSSLAQTDRPLPAWIRRLTGIRPADLRDAPPFATLAPRLAELLDGTIFVAHDLNFDLPFLRWEFSRHGLALPEVIGLCTLQLSRLVWPELESHRLTDLARRFAVTHRQPHRAADDAAATAAILRRALRSARQLGITRLGDLYRGEILPADRAASGAAYLRAEAAG